MQRGLEFRVWGLGYSLVVGAHARTSVMLTRKGGWQHRLQILREAESILNPDEPWPYTELLVEDYPDLPPVNDGLDTIQVHSDGEKGEEIEGASCDSYKDVDAGDGEERRARATSSWQSTSKSHATGSKRPKSTGRSLSARLKARRRAEGSADGSRDGSASDHSRATTPAAAAESPLSSSSPAAQQSAADANRSHEAETPMPPSPLQAAGKYRMLRCV